jgi:sarcosine oxidase
VTTSKTTYDAEHLVLAPGAWADDLLKLPSLPLHVRRHVMAWFEPVAETESFSPNRFPIYIWQADSRQIFYGFPVTGDPDTGAKVGIHSGGDICTATSIQREIQESDIAEIREQLATYIPALNGKLLQAATCMYTMTPDEHFVVSPHPHYRQVTVACGFSGHGFKFASVIGEILADLAIEGHTNQPIDFLSAQRFAK